MQRVRKLNDAAVAPGGRYVCTGAAGTGAWSRTTRCCSPPSWPTGWSCRCCTARALTCDYPYASDRLHTFVLEGVPETAAALRKLGIGYMFQLPRRQGRGSRAIAACCADAAAVVTDDCPLPEHADIGRCAYAVDSSCVVPARLRSPAIYAAYSIRPKIHSCCRSFSKPRPGRSSGEARFADRSGVAHEVSAGRSRRWWRPARSTTRVPPSTTFRGGRAAARSVV